jgi:hypothetical protein
MRNLFPRRSTSLALLSIAGLSLAALIAIRHDAPPAVVRQKVLVTFEGPWAFAVDPDDATSIFAFAPKTMSHHDMVVKSSESEAESEPLAAGVYEVILQIPPEARRNTAVDSKILQAKIDAQGVQHALLARGERYAVRLPRPEAYVAGRSAPIRAGTEYPPGPSTEKNYAMNVSLRYSAITLRGFTVVGSPDGGSAFHPVIVPVPNLSFIIRPLAPVMDECEVHNREAFRDLAKLVNLKLFVDFPESPSECHATDPQKPPA